jgi:uncharacterized membrane protein
MSGGVETGAKSRLNSIDFLRGLVMVIMALDHVRDYFTDVRFDPLDLDQGSTELFLTRWITHFCAPVFVLLAGTSAGFMAARRSTAELSKFLISRGLWLIFVEAIIVTYGWTFSNPFSTLIFQVIWAIGVSMLVMAALVWTPKWFIMGFGIIMVFGHNILDLGVFPEPIRGPNPFWQGLHNQIFTLDFGTPAFIAYPVIPWIGLMPLGYLLADLYQKPSAERQQSLIWLGVSAVILFVVLRVSGVYGEPNPFEGHENNARAALDFLDTTKYPPSLLYLLMTLGPALITLGYAERWRGRFVDWMVTFGRVPFFYYILHIYVIHLGALVAAELTGFGWQATAIAFFQFPAEYGFGLPVVYAVWVALIIALYPACKWFAGVKARRKDWWLSYL